MAYGTIKVDTIENTNGQTGNAIGPGFKNRIINGDMRIDQRNAGASVTPADGAYTIDRWNYNATQASKMSVQQSTTTATGFSNSMLVTTTTAVTVGAGDTFSTIQCIEGFNFADMMWGTANAKTITMSFWVRSSLTGTFGGALLNSAQNRSYPFTYTISSANTFEYKTITIAGDTTGTWIGSTNGIGVRVCFNLGTGTTYSGTAGAWAGATYYSATGATSIVGTNGATFYITGVQLEVGSTATSFDYRPYGTELQLCQRYFYSFDTTTLYAHPGSALSANNSATRFYFPTTMRATPTGAVTGTVGSSSSAWTLYNNGDYRTATSVNIQNPNKNSMRMDVTTSSGVAASDAILIYCFDNNGGASLTASAEL